MIVNEGAVQLLKAQQTMLSLCTWRLYTADLTITATTVAADLTPEAAWTGYARQTATSWGTPFISGSRAIMTNTTLPSFDNSSGSPVTFYVVALVLNDGVSDYIISANNFGLTTIPAGNAWTVNPAITDRQEV